MFQDAALMFRETVAGGLAMEEAPVLHEHLRSEHLYKIASTQDNHLTPLELKHLRSCVICSDRFAQIVFDYIHRNDTTTTA